MAPPSATRDLRSTTTRDLRSTTTRDLRSTTTRDLRSTTTRDLRFHRRLNPQLWHADGRLRAAVRVHLLRTALEFYRFLDVPGLRLADVVLTGSNAGYNYTGYSDIDVHLVTDLARAPCPALSANLFATKKALWSATQHVTIHGQPVELYVEDAAEPVASSGVYSLPHARWVRMPSATPPRRHDRAVRRKVLDYLAAMRALFAGGRPHRDDIDALVHRLRNLRRNGLLAGGEFSIENLAFKELRGHGVLDRLRRLRGRTLDAELSLSQ